MVPTKQSGTPCVLTSPIICENFKFCFQTFSVIFFQTFGFSPRFTKVPEGQKRPCNLYYVWTNKYCIYARYQNPKSLDKAFGIQSWSYLQQYHRLYLSYSLEIRECFGKCQYFLPFLQFLVIFAFFFLLQTYYVEITQQSQSIFFFAMKRGLKI